MSKLPIVSDILTKAAPHFTTQNNFGLKFESECLFARQQIVRNDFTIKTVQKNPDSLRGAILNVAAIGISLNPATAHAYLVPRDGAICLDISYRGLVKLATDSGAIEWAKAVLVYEGDKFTWKGPATAPEHEADVFNADRIDATDPLKNLKGGYCIAKLATGEVMVETMTAGEILEVKNSSKAQKGPWSGSWAGEMAKKTLVKRASKSWPQSAGRDRLDTAIQVLNEHEGINVEAPTEEAITEQFLNLVATGTPLEVFAYMKSLSEKDQTTCYNTAPHGEKVKLKNRVKAMEQEGVQIVEGYADSITELAGEGDPAVIELYDELTDLERRLVDEKITDITHRQISALMKEIAA